MENSPGLIPMPKKWAGKVKDTPISKNQKQKVGSKDLDSSLELSDGRSTDQKYENPNNVIKFGAASQQP